MRVRMGHCENAISRFRRRAGNFLRGWESTRSRRRQNSYHRIEPLRKTPETPIKHNPDDERRCAGNHEVTNRTNVRNCIVAFSFCDPPRNLRWIVFGNPCLSMSHAQRNGKIFSLPHHDLRRIHPREAHPGALYSRGTSFLGYATRWVSRSVGPFAETDFIGEDNDCNHLTLRDSSLSSPGRTPRIGYPHPNSRRFANTDASPD